MAIYSDLAKLGRVQLPSGSKYALIDVDGRAIIAPNFSTQGTYAVGDHVIYQDNLYRAKSAITTAGAWNSANWDNVTVDSEIKRIEGIIAGGIHYRGKTSTGLYDGATTNPITINGNSYTADSGDLVIVELDDVCSAYATNTAYSANTYLKNSGTYYITNAAITASENTSIAAIESKLDKITSDPEFLFDGTAWSSLGSIADGLGSLAFKDSASGTYVKPTGSGTVTINTYSATTVKLTTSTIVGTDGTLNASNITDITKEAFAVAAAEATPNIAQADAENTLVGNADVGSSVSVGTSLSGTVTFNTDAIKSASLTGTKTFNTDAIKSASLTGTTTFTTSGVTASVDGDCLTFSTSPTGAVGITTSAASTGTVGITTSAASTGTVTLTTSDITPAKAVSASSTKVRGVSGTVSIRGVSGTASAVTVVTYSGVTPAKVASSATTFATGQTSSTASGASVLNQLTPGTTTGNVTVGTTTDTVVVK